MFFERLDGTHFTREIYFSFTFSPFDYASVVLCGSNAWHVHVYGHNDDKILELRRNFQHRVVRTIRYLLISIFCWRGRRGGCQLAKEIRGALHYIRKKLLVMSSQQAQPNSSSQPLSSTKFVEPGSKFHQICWAGQITRLNLLSQPASSTDFISNELVFIEAIYLTFLNIPSDFTVNNQLSLVPTKNVKNFLFSFNKYILLNLFDFIN